MVVLFGIGFFKFRKDPKPGVYANLFIFSSCGIFSILGFVMTHAVLKGSGITV